MAKIRSEYVCQSCGAKSPKWIGKCNSCGEWNTYVEEVITKPTSKSSLNFIQSSGSPIVLSNHEAKSEERLSTNSKELNRILGGGLVLGSVVLIGGEPGIGKSTLALQVALGLNSIKSLYISGEESISQIKLRADRIGKKNDNCYFLSETSLEGLLYHFEKFNPELIFIDSIQTLHTEAIESSPGSISQVRECTNRILKYAKQKSIPVILIGHINKEGSIAGPKVLEHIVDTVLYFEGDKNYLYRILRSTKNRFGSTSEIGIFEMLSEGLREVENPSELLISQFDEQLSGTSIAATVDGIRPFLIETQALVSSAVYGTPQRSSTGFDYRRLNMLLAVLEKRAGFKLASKDVFLNIAGGLKVNDPAIDLAIIAAILSSNVDISLGKSTCFAGEIGLTGEVRPVSRIEQRISEAKKLGFKKMLISKYNMKNVENKNGNIEIVGLNRVENAVKELFG
ncbi:DNA repair protein RadA [Bacteroidota bacterium]